MITSLKNIFNRNESNKEIDNKEELKILCGLMMEAANTDCIISEEELKKITYILVEIFNEDKEDVEKILVESWFSLRQINWYPNQFPENFLGMFSFKISMDRKSDLA